MRKLPPKLLEPDGGVCLSLGARANRPYYDGMHPSVRGGGNSSNSTNSNDKPLRMADVASKLRSNSSPPAPNARPDAMRARQQQNVVRQTLVHRPVSCKSFVARTSSSTGFNRKLSSLHRVAAPLLRNGFHRTENAQSSRDSTRDYQWWRNGRIGGQKATSHVHHSWRPSASENNVLSRNLAEPVADARLCCARAPAHRSSSRRAAAPEI